MPFYGVSYVPSAFDGSTTRLSVGNSNAGSSTQTALGAGDFANFGPAGTEASTTRIALVWNNHGSNSPSAANARSNGDKCVFYNSTAAKVASGMDGNLAYWFQSNGTASAGFIWYAGSSTTATQVMKVDVNGLLTTSSATLHATNTTLTNGAAAAVGTLNNAPAAGNPTKWVPINDNGTTRYIPAW